MEGYGHVFFCNRRAYKVFLHELVKFVPLKGESLGSVRIFMGTGIIPFLKKNIHIFLFGTLYSPL